MDPKPFPQNVPSSELLLALVLAGLFYLWRQAFHLFHEPPLLVAGLGVGLLALFTLLGHGPPWTAWAWWGFGLLTLLWSLAPGHTLVAALWEAWLLLALAAGRWRMGVLVLLSLLLLEGLYTALALWQTGLVTYVSGSHHYLLGALALGGLPLFLARVARREAYPLASFLLAVLALYAALISGARAVYLPLALLLPLLALRLAQEGLGLPRALLLLLALGGGVALLEALVPGNAVLHALAFKAHLTRAEAQGPSGPEEGEAPSVGNMEARLLMWRLALRLALDHPLGTGNGGYSQVFEAYMDYPGLAGVWSRSPHNYLLETLATGGFPRLALLLCLLWPAVRAFWGRDWPWALAAFGLLTPTLFDVSGHYPGYLAVAFLPLGALGPSPAPRWLGLGGSLLALALFLSWYGPCQGAACLERRQYFPAHVARALAQAAPEERTRLLQEAQRRYPLSPWPLVLALRQEPDPKTRLEVARELAQRFPYAREGFYLAWAEAALALGRREEALEALERGLRHFPGSEALGKRRRDLEGP
jgi:O-antigen ligase